MPLYPPSGGGGVTIEEVIDTLYPIGSIYISTLATNPGTLLGRGTWAIFGAGKVLVGIDSADASFDVLEETGGAKTHTLITSEMPIHFHGVTDGGHTHILKGFPTSTGGLEGFTRDTSMSGTTVNTDLITSQSGSAIAIQDAGGGGAHNNLQPYIVVAAWKRTA